MGETNPRLNCLHALIGAGLLAFSVCASAATAVQEVRLSANTDMTRVVFDLSQPAAPKILRLTNPERIVLDWSNAQLACREDQLPEGGQVRKIRAGMPARGVLRLVLDVGSDVDVRGFAVEPSESAGHRWVLDLKAGGAPAAQSAAIKESEPSDAQAIMTVEPAAGRNIVVAIDAGHGGEDPGALGRRGTREKDVTLAIAQRLKALIDAEPGMRAVLTRDADMFVPLRERIVRATKQHADIFISIHADSVRDRAVRGSSVYVLSAGRASSEAARMLADRENAADLVGGAQLDAKDDVLASVLLDLSQGASMSASVTAADHVLTHLDRVGAVLDRDVKHASLKVLTSPEIPSMLIETAFISNPAEEAKLRSAAHQQKLAGALHAGVRAYFYQNPLPGTRIAQLKAQQRKIVRTGGAGTSMLAAGGVSP